MGLFHRSAGKKKCWQCGNEYEAREGQNYCPKCGGAVREGVSRNRPHHEGREFY